MERDALIMVFVGVIIFLSIMIYFMVEFYKNQEKFSSMAPNSYRSYVINMKRNPERLANFLTLYTQSDIRNVPLSIIDAIDGKKINIEKLVTKTAFDEIIQTEDVGHRTMHYQLTRGAVGCYLSHIKTWKAVAEQDEKFAIVFEDDVMFSSDIFASIVKVIETLPDWDMLLLGCICLKCNKNSEKTDIQAVQQFWHMHGYVINKSVAKKLVNNIDGKDIEMQIDSVISAMATNGQFAVYCVTQPIAKQNNGFMTTIQTAVIPTRNIDPFLLI